MQSNFHPHKNAFKPRQILTLAAMLCCLAMPASAAKLYKWVDENGAVRYSDHLPAQQPSTGHQQLNSQGVVLSTSDAPKTPEELAAEAEAKKKLEEAEREAARLKEIQQKEDRVLLLTFGSEAEIEHARDNRMEVIDSVIRLIQGSIHSTQKKLDDLQNIANRNYVSQGKEIPGGLAQKIEHFQRKIENRNAQLQEKSLEKEKIREKYELDLQRYRVLNSASN